MFTQLSANRKFVAFLFSFFLFNGLPLISVAQDGGYVAPRKSSETAKYEYQNSHPTNSTNKITIINIPASNKDDKTTIESLVKGADITDDVYYSNLIDSRNAEFIRNGVLPPSADNWRRTIADLKANEWPAKMPAFYAPDSGYATARHHNLEGVIDNSGNIIIPIIWASASGFSNGLGYVKAPGIKGKVGFMDKTNTLVIPLKYEACWLGFSLGLAAVKQGGKWGYIDVNDVPVIPFKYDYAEKFGNNGYALVKKKNKVGILNRTGVEVIPVKYEWVSPSDYGDLYSCLYKGKYGVVNILTGATVIEHIYEKYIGFSMGKAMVTLKGRTFYIDKTGAEVAAP